MAHQRLTIAEIESARHRVVRLTRGSSAAGAAPRSYPDAWRGHLHRRQRYGLPQQRVRLARVRNAHRFDEMRLELRFDRGFDLFHAPHQLLDGMARLAVKEGNARAGTGGIAGGQHLGEVAVRDHAENHRVLDIDVAAERTG